MIAAVLDTFRKNVSVANEPVTIGVDAAKRFEPVSRILERCDEISLEIARPIRTSKANN